MPMRSASRMPLAAAVARGDVARTHVVLRTVLGHQRHARFVGGLLHRRDARGEAQRHRRMACEPLAQLRLEDRLTERRATRKAVLARIGEHLGEAAAARAEVMRAVAGHDGLLHDAVEPDELHRAQRFVVDRHRSRLVDRGRVAFHHERAYARLAEDVGERETGRAPRPRSRRRRCACPSRQLRMIAVPHRFSVRGSWRHRPAGRSGAHDSSSAEISIRLSSGSFTMKKMSLPGPWRPMPQ